ncbi:hypothetical protein JCM3774_005808 [Rhodotorula dairenensis]
MSFHLPSRLGGSTVRDRAPPCKTAAARDVSSSAQTLDLASPASQVLYRRRAHFSSSDSLDSLGSETDAATASEEGGRLLASEPLRDRTREKAASSAREQGRYLTMHSWGKGHRHHRHHRHGHGSDDDDGDAKDTLHLGKRTKGLITLGVLVVVCAAGGFVAWKWGTEIYAEAKDFMTFPELKTPVDLTGAIVSVWGEATEHVVGAFSTATAAVAGAEKTATSAVAGAAETAAAAITNVAQDAGKKVEDVGKKIGGIFGG